MEEGRYSVDVTRVMKHQNKMWNLSDYSLAFMGGISWVPAGFAIAAGLIFGPLIGGIGSVVLGMPKTLTMIIVGLIAAAGVYYPLARSSDGREGVVTRLKVAGMGLIRDPGAIRGASRNRSPRKLRWVAIVWRPDWANIDLNRRPTLVKYEVPPVNSERNQGKKEKRVTFDDLF